MGGLLLLLLLKRLQRPPAGSLLALRPRQGLGLRRTTTVRTSWTLNPRA